MSGWAKKTVHPSFHSDNVNNDKYVIKQWFYWRFKIIMNNRMKSSCLYCYSVKYSMVVAETGTGLSYRLLQFVK